MKTIKTMKTTAETKIFSFPQYGFSIEATSQQEATEKAEKKAKKLNLI